MYNGENDDIALKYGAYSSFKTDAEPSLTEYYGENPRDEVERLLNIYAKSDCKMLDLGCGAGHTMRKFSPKVKEFWGIDCNEELLLYASKVAKDNGLDNVTLIYGNTTSPNDVEKLPDDHFDVILSQRGPNMNEFLVKKLKEEGIFIQEYVGHFDGYPLKEIFGRRNYSPYDYYDVEAIICRYAEIELFPVSVKEYFYNEYYADIEHLKSYLIQQQGANLSNWRLSSRPYEEDLDRVSLELYAKYNITSKGIRLMRHRNIFVFRKTKVSYYPVDSIKLFKHQP